MREHDAVTATTTFRRAAAHDRPAAPGPVRADWVTAIALVVATRALLLAAAWAGQRLLGDGVPVGFAATWRRWDADLYLKIAAGGYAGSDPFSEAFLPGLPGAVKALTSLGLAPVAAGMLLTAAASVVACAYLVRLVRETGVQGGPGAVGLDRTAGPRAALYLLLLPTAVFLVAAYTEAPFLAGAIPAFHHARRGEWGRAAPFAALTTITRTAGVFVLLGLAIEWWRRRPRAPWWQPAASLTAGAAPFAVYLGFLWATRGSPLFLLTAQREGWGRTFVGPVDALTTTLDAGAAATGKLAVTWRLEVVAAVIGIALVVALARRREWGYVAFVGPLLAVLLSSTWYYSLPRILLTCFPLVVLLAAWSGRSRLRHTVTLAALTATAVAGTLTFTSGAWFF